MKRMLSLFLTMALMLTLAACGSKGGQDSNSASSAPEGDTPTSTIPETPPANQRSDTTPAEEQTLEGTDDGEKKVLIAYFSATNNTENIANHLNDILQRDCTH